MKREENKLGQLKPENIIWKYELFAMNRTEKKQTMFYKTLIDKENKKYFIDEKGNKQYWKVIKINKK